MDRDTMLLVVGLVAVYLLMPKRATATAGGSSGRTTGVENIDYNKLGEKAISEAGDVLDSLIKAFAAGQDSKVARTGNPDAPSTIQDDSAAREAAMNAAYAKLAKGS